jgi:signal transduction histidine kinase/ligand-binding sensor domain-containing protein
MKQNVSCPGGLLLQIEISVFQSRFFKSCSFLALLAVFVSVAASQSDQQPAKPEADLPAVTVTPTPTVADNATINLHRWGAVTLFHGLPSDRVNAIAEDASGVLWFGTDNGLVRYDGRNVHEALLPSRRILALKLDHRGDLWIGTDAGAARLRGNRIEVLPETRGSAVSGIASSRQGGQGEVTIVKGGGEIIRYQERAEGESRSESGAQIRLVATRLDPNTHPLLKSPKQADEILPLAAVTLISSGDWLIGSSGRGLLINRGNDLREASTRPPRPYFISSIYDDGARVWLAEQASARAGGLWFWKHPVAPAPGAVPGDGTLARTSFDAGPLTAVHGGDGELWVGSTGRGAFLLRFEDGGVKRVEHLTFENTAGGLRSNRINAIFRDREGVVWFGSDRGVCRYDRSSFRASTVSNHPQSNYVRVMLHTSDGETWLGTNRGLFKLATGGESSNPDRGASDSWAEVPELEGRSIYTLTENGGAVWVGAVGGLFVKPKGASNFSRVPSATDASTTGDEASNDASAGAGNEAEQAAPKETPQVETQQATQEQATRQPDVSATKEIVRAIAGFRGQIYAAFYESRVERVETSASGFTRAPALTDAGARRATCMAVERQNGADAALWYGTADGELRRFDGSRTTSIPLPQKQSSADRGIRALAVTDRGVWIGSSHGLYLREGDSFSEIKPDVDVWSLLVTRETAQENAPREIVWVATRNAGLIKLLFYQKEKVSARFDTEQGLPSQQIFAVTSGANGEVWIGTNRGVARHRPSQVEPRLQIKRLVADKIYLPEDLTTELPLPHTARSLLLEVAGIGSKTFSSQFQYEFTRFDKNGNETKNIQTDPQFPVENLQSGLYTIVARAISRDLVYSAPLSLRLRIERAPFPWATLLLATLLAVAVAAAALAFRQQFRLAATNRALEKTNIELTETRLRLANETEAERSRIARDLHDQTLADLRHLLVMTDQLSNGAPQSAPSSASSSSGPSSGSPSGLEDSTPSPVALRRKIEAISSEIRHICEDLSPSALENIGFLPALEWALSNAVAQLPAEEKFAYEFTCETSLEDSLRLSHIERIQLYRMVQEALNNTCRHARAKHVNMDVRVENSTDLVIEVRDDGVGFDGARINKTGHGIANIRSRANLIGAKAEWKNARPGCRFEIRKEGCVTADRGLEIAD